MHHRFRRRDALALQVLEPRGRAMRLAPRATEAKLWGALRRGALGVRFRRQVVLGPYVVDFLAPSVGLVVEVDGGVHAESAESDAARVRALEAMGLRVLRLDSRLVDERVAEAVAIVVEALTCGCSARACTK